MLSLNGNADKTHPFFFEGYFLDTVTVLFCFLLIAEEGVVNGKAEDLPNPIKGKLNTRASVAGKESPKRLIFAQ